MSEIIVADPKPLVVFISYSWDFEEFKNAIWELAGYLHANATVPVTIITDHLFSHRPPPKGWTTWMQHQIENADIVISVCSKPYHDFFENKEDFDSKGGYGVTHEANLIKQLMLSQKGTNSKFFPILPDGCGIQEIPLTLQMYNNNICFPSNNIGVMKLICGTNPSHSSIASKPNKINTFNNGTTATIKTEIALENQLNEAIADKLNEEKGTMALDRQILIRAYVSLSDMQRAAVINSFSFDIDDLDDMTPFEKDKLFIKKINDEELLTELWDAINNVKPFYS